MRASRIDTLILVTTSHYGQRADGLARLAASVEQSRQAMPHVRVDQRLLLQAAPEIAQIPGGWTLRRTSEQLGLSSARNRLLAELPASFLTDTTVVAYPDDDAWYAEAALAGILTAFAEDSLLDLWFCRSGPEPKWRDAIAGHPPQLQQLLSNATSNTLFVRGSLAARLGGFDEALGLGTLARSGEDTDYALRAFQLARRTRFLPATVIGHRAPDRRDRELYFEGALYAIARHAPAVRGGFIALGRKIAIGVVLVTLGQIEPSRLWASLRTAFRLLLLTRC